MDEGVGMSQVLATMMAHFQPEGGYARIEPGANYFGKHLPAIRGVRLRVDDIKAKFAVDQFEFSQHAVDQSLLESITVAETREAIAAGEVIEDYPNDKYGPSCLILGWTNARRPLHIQCSYPSRPLVKVVTL